MATRTNRTIARGIRLPKALDRSVMTAAKTANTTFTTVIIQILAEAVASGRLPKPRSESDKAQLAFL